MAKSSKLWVDLDINMKRLSNNWRSNEAGSGLVVVIVLLAIIGGLAWWLFNTKNTSDREARAFGREMIQRLAVQHDQAFFANHLGPQARMDFPPSQQQYMMGKLTEMGVPAQPIKIDETVTFESKFFSPRGFFTAHLNYPAQSATMEVAVSHPVSKWQIDNLTMTWDRPR
jgi:hypothetical protein